MLCGLKAISDRAVESFSRHEWDLHLDGIHLLSDNAATFLSEHKSLVSLKGLTEISHASAKAFAKRRPDLSCFSEPVAKLIAEKREADHGESSSSRTHRVEQSHEGGFYPGSDGE